MTAEKIGEYKAIDRMDVDRSDVLKTTQRLERANSKINRPVAAV